MTSNKKAKSDPKAPRPHRIGYANIQTFFKSNAYGQKRYTLKTFFHILYFRIEEAVTL